MKRGSIGLSIEMLVVIIISLVILSGGIVLLYQFIGGAEDIKAQLDERTSAELERLLVDQGQRVALPLHVATVTRGESHVYGLGILNVDSRFSKFSIEVSLSDVLDEKGVTLGYDSNKRAQLATDWVIWDSDPANIPEGGSKKEGILVQVSENAATGTYIFDARVNAVDTVTNNPVQYGNTQKFYVKVK